MRDPTGTAMAPSRPSAIHRPAPDASGIGGAAGPQVADDTMTSPEPSAPTTPPSSFTWMALTVRLPSWFLICSLRMIVATLTGVLLAYTAKIRGAVKRTETATTIIADDVATKNAQTIGALADAAESRRVDHIDAADRTDEESDHLAALPIPARPNHQGDTQ